jgi:hypothetical protein
VARELYYYPLARWTENCTHCPPARWLESGTHCS